VPGAGGEAGPAEGTESRKRKAAAAAQEENGALGEVAPFDFSTVQRPGEPGDKITLHKSFNEVIAAECGPDKDSITVTVRHALGRNNKPLRSRLFELGVLFEPVLRGGHNFLCCVPVKDKETGEMRPCNAVLKIPQGSLGNPFRHLRRQHPSAYNACCVNRDEKKSAGGKGGKAKAPKQRKTRYAKMPMAEEVDPQSVVDRAGEELGKAGDTTNNNNNAGAGAGARGRASGGRDKSALHRKWAGNDLVKKGVTFLAMNLLPLDIVKGDIFRSFFTATHEPGASGTGLQASKRQQQQQEEELGGVSVDQLYKTLLEGKERVVQGIRLRLGQEAASAPPLFLRVRVVADFVPGPLVALDFTSAERGEQERVHLPCPSGASGSSPLGDRMGSLCSTVDADRTTADFKAGVVACVYEVFAAYGLEALCKRVQSVVVPSPGASSAGNASVAFPNGTGAGTNVAEEELEALKLAEEAAAEAIQTKRDVRVIERDDFLPESMRAEEGQPRDAHVKAFLEATLITKYNPDFVL